MRKTKILVVDDSANIRRLVTEALTMANYDVVEAVSGETVYDILNMQNDISLILLDIDMPIMNGYDTMKVIKPICKDRGIKVCFVTAMDEKEDVLKAIALGASAYITKPIRTEILLTKVKNLIESPYMDLSAKLDTELSAQVSDELKIDMEIKVTQISPTGLVFESMIELTDNLSVSVHCPKLIKLLELTAPLKCKIINSFKQDSIYVNETFFVDLSDSIVKKIKKIIFSNQKLID